MNRDLMYLWKWNWLTVDINLGVWGVLISQRGTKTSGGWRIDGWIVDGPVIERTSHQYEAHYDLEDFNVRNYREMFYRSWVREQFWQAKHDVYVINITKCVIIVMIHDLSNVPQLVIKLLLNCN